MAALHLCDVRDYKLVGRYGSWFGMAVANKFLLMSAKSVNDLSAAYVAMHRLRIQGDRTTAIFSA